MQIDSWLRDDVPVGQPPVAKKGGSTRWAVDFRELNKFTVPDSFPTPNLSQVIESLAGSEISLHAAQLSIMCR